MIWELEDEATSVVACTCRSEEYMLLSLPTKDLLEMAGRVLPPRRVFQLSHVRPGYIDVSNEPEVLRFARAMNAEGLYTSATLQVYENEHVTGYPPHLDPLVSWRHFGGT